MTTDTKILPLKMRRDRSLWMIWKSFCTKTAIEDLSQHRLRSKTAKQEALDFLLDQHGPRKMVMAGKDKVFEKTLQKKEKRMSRLIPANSVEPNPAKQMKHDGMSSAQENNNEPGISTKSEEKAPQNNNEDIFELPKRVNKEKQPEFTKKADF